MPAELGAELPDLGEEAVVADRRFDDMDIHVTGEGIREFT
jgi:hypothetical protein